MPKPIKEKPEKKKKPLLWEICTWAFDLAFLGLLIWFFSSTQNQAALWSAVSGSVSKTVVAVAEYMHSQEPKHSEEIKKAPTPATETPPKSKEADSATPPPPVFVPPPLPTEEQLSKEVPGDCFPPEVRSANEKVPEVASLFYTPPPLPKERKARKGHGKPVKFEKCKIKGVPFYKITLNLKDPDAFIVIRLPNKATQANSTTFSGGHENFDSFVKEYPCAAMVNGTFFSKDEQERVMGNMVSDGKSLKYSPWENYGTTLALLEDDVPEMVTCRAEGTPKWSDHWFSLTCGPRLLKGGEVWLNPELEGFADPHVLGVGPRSAIGFPESRDKLIIVTFLRGLSLKEEANLMKEIGCSEAMNLDGGASKGVSHNSSLVMKPGRALTNVLVVYDSAHRAPPDVVTAWENFQEGERPSAH